MWVLREVKWYTYRGERNSNLNRDYFEAKNFRLPNYMARGILNELRFKGLMKWKDLIIFFNSPYHRISR